MAHRPRLGHVILTRYANKPEELNCFLSEMEDIRQKEDKTSTSSPGTTPTPTGGGGEDEDSDNNEQEEDANWLKKAGFENVVQLLEKTEGDEFPSSHIDTSGLPKSHAIAIRQRMHTLRTTIRSRRGLEKRRGSGHVDVRQLFIDSKQYVADSSESSIELKAVHSRTSTTHLVTSNSSAAPVMDERPHPSTTPISDQASTDASTTPTTDNNDPDSPTIPPPPPPPPPPLPPHDLPLSKSSSPSPDNSATPTQADIKLSFCLSSYSQLSKSESLPSIALDPDSLGITTVDDLSEGDMEKIRCLAHIELTITFEENNISFKTLRIPKIKINNVEEKQFGSSLSLLLQNDQQRNPKADIPLLFKEMILYLENNGLHDEGILRVSGSRQRIKDMQEDIEANFSSGSFTFEGRKTVDVASLLKQFIRELPVPLLTYELLPSFASIADINDLKEQVRTLNLLILILPSLHQSVLKSLLQFCEKIYKETEYNKMDLNNVSMVLAPNLFYRLSSSKLSCNDVTLAAKTTHVVLLMIRYHHVLWTVPSGMLTQVRFLYEYELKKLNKRNVKQALQKMNQSETTPPPKKQEPASNNVIKVKTPYFTSISKVVNIQENPTAGTVIAKLRKRSQLDFDVIRRVSMTNSDITLPLLDNNIETPTQLDEDMTEQYLYEVGGNIGERRLHPDTNMLVLYEVNPLAEWVIKPKNCPSSTE